MANLNFAQHKKIESENIERVMAGLMIELAKLAPHPDRPDEVGPLFVQVESQYKPAAEYEGMLGSLVMDSLLGGGPGLGVSDLLDMAGEYIRDRAPARYTLGQKKSICANFNQRASWRQMLETYLRDMPRRLGIERWLAEYQRKLYAMRKHAPAPAL